MDTLRLCSLDPPLTQVPTSRATNVDAAYGCARLAAKYYFLDQAAKLELQGAGKKA